MSTATAANKNSNANASPASSKANSIASNDSKSNNNHSHNNNNNNNNCNANNKNNENSKQQRLRYIGNVVRALVTSRKPPCKLREVLREYPEIEGEPLNFRKYGYTSAKELLKATGEFTFMQYGDETYINATHSQKSAHISSMVRQQKSSSSTKSTRITPVPQIRQPKRTDQSWNKSSYSSNVYQRLQQATINQQQHQRGRNAVSAGGGGGDRNNNNNQQQNNNNYNRNNQQQKPQQQQQQQTKSTQPQKTPQQQQQQQQQKSQQQSQQQPKSQQQQPQQQQLKQAQQSPQKQKQQSQQQQQQQQQQNKPQQQSTQQKSQQQSSQQQQKSQDSARQQQQTLQRQKSVGASGGKDLRDMLNAKMPQQQQQQQQSVQQQSGAAASNSNNANSNGSGNKVNNAAPDLRERLSNYKKPQQSQQQQQQTDQQQKSVPRPILGQNNNSAIAIASTLILAQREQKLQEQHQQQRAQLLAAQHLRQQQQLLQQQMLQQQQTQQLLEQTLKQQQQQQQTRTKMLPAAAAASAPIAMPGNAAAIVNNSVQHRLRVRINNGGSSATNGNGHTNGNNTPDSSPSISSAGSEKLTANPFVGAMLQQQQQQLPQPQFHKRYVANTQYQDANGAQVIPPRIFQFNPKLDPITSLAQYCVVRRYAPPGYSTIYSKFSRLYQCRVNVNGTIFSTYPNEYPNEHIAKISCAQKAIDQLKLQESRRPLPLCADSDAELVEKLYAELLQHPHGIFAKNIPEMFSEAYQQSLPEHWWTLVQTSHKFTTESATNNAVIVFANLDADKDKAPGTPGAVIQMDGIPLPWKQKYWQLYITYCASTVDVWARLFGKEYSERFDAVMNEIDGYMKTQRARPLSLACKNIYLVCINECWHRVRVEELDKPNSTARCFFIDYGDNDWVAVSELYICEAQFLRLPAQAVLFSLFGLEDFAGNPNARRHLDTMLSSKSVVGEILTKDTDFYNTESSACGKIQVVLYDTSTEEDVNLNPLLLSKICNDTPPPEIKHKGATNVLVSHVGDEGDLYLQILNTDFKYVQKLIQQLIESKFKREQHKITHNDLKRTNLFLICDDTNGGSEPQWYRGALTDTPFSADDEEFDIYYVDHGITRRTHISKMFRLESLSAALSKFPRQAIRARLHNIPPISKSIVGRMRALLPANCAAFVKMNKPGKLPYVTVYRRHESSDMLCNINEDIRMEAELESTSAALNPDDDDALGNGPLSKNSSGSSLPSPSSTKSFMDMTRGLTITSVPNSPQKSAELPKLKNYDEIPNDTNEFFEVRVTMSANPSNFTIQPYKDYPRLRDIMKELQEYCENNDEFIPADMVEIGQAYAAKNPDGFYHRVTVVNTYNGEMIHVCFCDFGDIAILRSDQLKILPAKYRQLPKMAMQAKLYGIKAKHGDWSLEDCLRFRQLTVAQKFMATIKRITYDKLSTPETQILELELIDVTTDDDVYIHEIMLKEQRAAKDDENN